MIGKAIRCEAVLVDSKQSALRRTTGPAVATVKARLYRNKNILTFARRQCTRVTSTRLLASTVVRSVHLERVVLALAFALLAVRRAQVGCAFRKSAGTRRAYVTRCRLSGMHAIIADRLPSFCPSPRFSSRRDAISHYRNRASYKISASLRADVDVITRAHFKFTLTLSR